MGIEGRRILLGVSGGIAAYKTPLVARLLVTAGAEVRAVMTSAATRFVTATTLEVVTRRPVHTDLFERSDEFPVLHVGLGEWAELVLIAPATANTIGKMANGIGDDLLSSVLLTAGAPVLLAPAMEEGMLENPYVQRNTGLLRKQGVGWIDPEAGELASGAHGKGRMASPEAIAAALEVFLGRGSGPEPDLAGLTVLVTAGPTCEDLDPVRFISNRSTGKMGYAVAARAVSRGAVVKLVSGPTDLQPPAGAEVAQVRSAVEMLEAARKWFREADIAVMAAAVADYRAAGYSGDKIERGSDRISLELVPNPDISAELGANKKNRVVVSFAMETEEGSARARAKLARKKSDLIALNNLREEGAGFAVDTNVVTLIDADGGEEALPRMSKMEVADRLLDRARELFARRRKSG